MNLSSSTVTGAPLPVTKNLNQNGEETLEATDFPSKNATEIISPHMVRPYPKAGPRKEVTKGRKKGKSRILTETSEKEEIEKQQMNKKEVSQEGQEKKAVKTL